MKKYVLGLGLSLAAGALPAHAEDIKFKPIVDARLRWENVDQQGIAQNADAVTMRLRMGGELRTGPFSFLAEAEGTLAIGDDYNDTINGKTMFPVVADPENVELNRLQLQYKTKAFTLTGGRQRINLDDQRFVGSVGWRQNEQTFDAVRAEAKLGPVTFDGTYSWSQRTVFGVDAGPRQAFSGDIAMLGAGTKLGPVGLKAFGYLIDYDVKEPVATLRNSSQTYGARATTSLKLSKAVKLDLAASYAHQSDLGSNPIVGGYDADYVALEGTLGYAGFKLTGGYELLGSDATANFAFQTPLATLHKFNGWADKFLTTPTTGLQDYYGGISYAFPKVGSVGPLVASFTYHRFHSDRGSIHYGDEYDAQISLKLTKSLSALVKYADYQRKGIASYPGDADTQKFWLQIDYAL